MITDRLDDKVTWGSKAAAFFIAGWMASSVWHQTAISDKAAQVLPAVEAARKCEGWRADKATVLAKQATMVDPAAIPKDHCGHPSVPVAEHPASK